MEVKTTKRTVEIEENRYISVDGKEFYSEMECAIHEESLAFDKAKRRLNMLEMKNLRNEFPLPFGRKGYYYKWYKVYSAKDIEDIDIVHNGSLKDSWSHIFDNSVSPKIVCVEYGGSHYPNDTKMYTFDFVKEYMVEFLDKVYKGM